MFPNQLFRNSSVAINRGSEKIVVFLYNISVGSIVLNGQASVARRTQIGNPQRWINYGGPA
jgi:hypothetical protein